MKKAISLLIAVVTIFVSDLFDICYAQVAKADPYCVSLSKYKSKMSNVTHENYIEAFKDGPCHPIILVPGFISSKLEFQMKDPKVFAQNHPEIVEKCGWKNLNAPELQRFLVWINTEATKVEELIMGGGKAQNKQTSKEEYIPHFFKRVKFLDFDLKYDDKKACYGSIMRNYFEIGDNGEIKVVGLKGAEITYYLPKDRRECGRESISNLLGTYSRYIKFAMVFDSIFDQLSNLGYKPGLSLFGFPYDWRNENSFHHDRLNRTINLAYTNTKKKSIIYGHSLGGTIAYELALKSPHLIEEVVAVGSPFLGSTGAIQEILEKSKFFDINKSIEFFGSKAEINAHLDEESIKLITSTNVNKFHFFPKPRLRDNIDENIISSMQKIFPTGKNKDNCKSVIEYLDRKTVCEIPYLDVYDHSMVSLNKEDKYFKTESELFDFIYDHKFYNNYDVLDFEQDKNIPLNRLDRLLFEQNRHKRPYYQDPPQPDVPFTFIYSNHLPVPSRFEINTHSEGTIKLEKVEHKNSGDGTVDAVSQIYPGMRWVTKRDIYSELINSESSDIKSHPIHFIEFCSFNKEYSVTQYYDPSKTQYIALPCECVVKKNSDPINECNHATMLSDKYLISFVEKMVKSKKAKPIEVKGYEHLYNRKFEKIMFCRNLYK